MQNTFLFEFDADTNLIYIILKCPTNLVIYISGQLLVDTTLAELNFYKM